MIIKNQDTRDTLGVIAFTAWMVAFFVIISTPVWLFFLLLILAIVNAAAEIVIYMIVAPLISAAVMAVIWEDIDELNDRITDNINLWVDMPKLIEASEE